MKHCTTCNREVTDDYVTFKAPDASNDTIIRCFHCRASVKPYTTTAGFTGP